MRVFESIIHNKYMLGESRLSIILRSGVQGEVPFRPKPIPTKGERSWHRVRRFTWLRFELPNRKIIFIQPHFGNRDSFQQIKLLKKRLLEPPRGRYSRIGRWSWVSYPDGWFSLANINHSKTACLNVGIQTVPIPRKLWPFAFLSRTKLGIVNWIWVVRPYDEECTCPC